MTLDKLLEQVSVADLRRKQGVTFVDTETKKRYQFNGIKYGPRYLLSCSNGEETEAAEGKVKDWIIYILTSHGLAEPSKTSNYVLW